MTAPRKKPAKRGRPAGRQTEQRPVVEASPSRCPRCRSTRRTPYRAQPVVQAIAGSRDGQPFTHVAWRVTRCADCGQARTDRAYLYEPAPAELEQLAAGESAETK